MLDTYLTFPNLIRAGGVFIFVLAVIFYRRRKRPMKVVTVIDGDTFMAVDPSGKKHKLRLRGVDCPELGQRYSFEARDFVHETVKGKWVQVRFYGRDRYRRQLVGVWVDEANLAREIIREGLGYPLKGSGLQMASLGAKIANKGVWSGFGQAKPWESSSREPSMFKMLNGSKQWRRFKAKRLEKRHHKKKK